MAYKRVSTVLFSIFDFIFMKNVILLFQGQLIPKGIQEAWGNEITSDLPNVILNRYSNTGHQAGYNATLWH